MDVFKDHCQLVDMKQANEIKPMRSTSASIAIRSFLILILLHYPGVSTMAREAAASHVILDAVYDADCETRGGKLIVVQSDHPSQDIEVQLERYFMNVRQGGRSVIRLHPGAPPRPLGCSRVLVDRAEQHWKLVKAIYLD